MKVSENNYYDFKKFTFFLKFSKKKYNKIKYIDNKNTSLTIEEKEELKKYFYLYNLIKYFKTHVFFKKNNTEILMDIFKCPILKKKIPIYHKIIPINMFILNEFDLLSEKDPRFKLYETKIWNINFLYPGVNIFFTFKIKNCKNLYKRQMKRVFINLIDKSKLTIDVFCTNILPYLYNLSIEEIREFFKENKKLNYGEKMEKIIEYIIEKNNKYIFKNECKIKKINSSISIEGLLSLYNKGIMDIGINYDKYYTQKFEINNKKIDIYQKINNENKYTILDYRAYSHRYINGKEHKFKNMFTNIKHIEIMKKQIINDLYYISNFYINYKK